MTKDEAKFKLNLLRQEYDYHCNNGGFSKTTPIREEIVFLERFITFPDFSKERELEINTLSMVGLYLRSISTQNPIYHHNTVSPDMNAVELFTNIFYPKFRIFIGPSYNGYPNWFITALTNEELKSVSNMGDISRYKEIKPSIIQ